MISEFESFRPRLTLIAYRMLGEMAEAEDVVQETFIRWQKANRSQIDNDRGWLTTVVTRLSIDRLRLLKRERERYVGPWLPTPIAVEAAESALMRSESLSYALLVMLEKLTPIERAVFLLREAFDFDYDVIAQIVERSVANCRQIMRRARQHLEKDPSRFHVETDNHHRLLRRFLESSRSGNLQALVDLLQAEVVAWSDGGGRVAAARHPIFGAHNVARFILGLIRLAPENLEVTLKSLNGQMGVVLSQKDERLVAILFETDGEEIQNIFLVRNPDKLRWV